MPRKIRKEPSEHRRQARREAAEQRRQARREAAETRRQKRRETTKARKWLRRLLILILAGALLCLIAHTAVLVRGNARILNLGYSEENRLTGLPEQKADCILILGAGLFNGYPSPMLRERLDLGAELYRAGASGKILVSGDNGRTDYNEVQAMEDYLAEQQGIPREDIVRDHAGFCTYDSIVRAKEIFCADSVIIVTQKYHLFRAAYIASVLGLETYGADAHKTGYSGRYGREARECLARVKDFFLCIFRPDPKFLGEKLPIKP